MAATISLLKMATILSILLFPLALIPISGVAQDPEEVDEYVLDKPLFTASLRSGSKVVIKKIRKGASCNDGPSNICPGVSVNNGTGLLQCCKKHCRNINGDRNNCGLCGQKCPFGQLCCNGLCTNIAYNVDHCGKCNKKCRAGVRCQYGTCGYA